MSEAKTEWVAVADLLRPQGRRGEVLAETLTELREVFADGSELWLAKSGRPPAEGAPGVKLESHFYPTGKNAGRIVLKLAGTDSISAAEALAGVTVYVPASAMPELEADTYFVRDLVGCELVDGDRAVGDVVDVEFAMAADGRTRLADAAPLLVVKVGEDEVMVPFIRAWIVEVDLAGKRLKMNLPEGLANEG